MLFLVTCIVCAILSWVAAPAIRKYPAALYALAALVVVLFFAGTFSAIPGPAGRVCYMLMRRGTIAMALFAVVMFTGVLPPGSTARIRMQSIRAELSIAACILIAAHIAVNFAMFVPRLWNPSTNISMLASIAIAVVLLILLLALGVTSFSFVKKHMDSQKWKTLQRFAYAFYGLAYLHIILLLWSGALSGSTVTQQNLVVYTVVFGVYAIARIVRAVVDRKTANEEKHVPSAA